MSVRGVSSHGNSIQSMSTKEICILVATNDLTWHNIVSRMLQICTYEVLDTGKADDVLKAIWERKEHVSVVFTNVHRLSSEGFDILQNIKNKLSLQTIVMSPDDENVAILEKGSIFVAYIVKFLNVNDIKNLWQSSLEIEKQENLKEMQGGKQKASGTTECNTGTSPIDEVTQFKCKRGREESLQEDEEPTDGRDDGPADKKQRMKETANDEVTRVHCKKGMEESSDESEEFEDRRENGRAEKKPRMVWTSEMHQKFLEAIEILGHEKAFPKKIVEVMEVPGLTRENVASHLQKYRMCIKRAQESDPIFLYGMNQTTAVQNECLSSGVSPVHSKFSYGNSYMRRNVYGAYVQPPSQRTLPNMLYHSATMYPKSSQMDIRNSQRINGNGMMNIQHGYPPNIMLKSNFRVYNDPKKNVLMNIMGRSALDSDMPSTSDPCTSFLGFRLTRDGKSVEVGGECIATNIKTAGSETLPQPFANGNTSQSTSTLNENQTSILSVDDYDYAENLIQPPPVTENCTLGQEPLSEQSSILANELINLYSPPPPANEYNDKYSSSPFDSVPQQQSFLPFYEAPDGVIPATSSMPDDTSSQHQVFMPLCQSSGDTIAAQRSMPMDPILQQLPSPSLYEVLGNEISAQCSMPMDPILQQLPSLPLYDFLDNEISAQSPTISGNFTKQHQYSVPPVPTSENVGTFQYIATTTIPEPPLPSISSTVDELEGILSGIGADFWNNDIDDIINAIND